MNGDVILISVKGNRNLGNEVVEIREILLDLRLRVYYINAIIISIIVFKILFFFEIFKGRLFILKVMLDIDNLNMII